MPFNGGCWRHGRTALHESFCARMHRFQIGQRVMPARELGEVAVLKKVAEQRAMSRKHGIPHFHQFAKELLSGLTRRMHAVLFLQVAPDDLRYSEAILAGRVRIHEGTCLFERLERDLMWPQRAGCAAMHPSPGSKCEGERNDAGCNRNPRRTRWKVPGLPDIPDIFFKGMEQLARYRCGRRQSVGSQ